MSELTPDLVPEVLAACEAGAEEASGALSRSLDNEFTMSVGEAASFDANNQPECFDGPGLVILMKFGGEGVVALLPESSEMLPFWYGNPDPTGESKMSTLAQELSMLLVPETMMADDFVAARVDNLAEALTAGGIGSEASLVALPLKAGEQTSQLSLIWPLSDPDHLFPEVEESLEAETSQSSPAAETAPPISGRIHDFSQLPAYSQSLLRIEVPVRVVLATKRESLQDIVEMASGSIIKFEKSCDEALHLYVVNQVVAEGEAVKVGDKFGFRVSTMVLPGEHFIKVKPRKTG